MPVNKNPEFLIRHNDIIRRISNLDKSPSNELQKYKVSNVPRVLYPPPKVRSKSTGSLQSNLPRVLYPRSVSMEPVSTGNSRVRPQTPYYKEAQLSKNIRTDTPHPKRDKTPLVFSSKLQQKQTVKELTKFFEELNKGGGGKYKKSKRVVKKANKKMI
jgi:hypothetical protein